MVRAYVGIGANLGDRAAQVCFARRALDDLSDTRVTACSEVYETAPVGPGEQRPYYNAAVELETGLSPESILRGLLAIEQQAGRHRREKWGPRTLDLDLLLYGERVISTEELSVPHPFLHERPFVLRPLADIDPGLVHPLLQMRVSELLSYLPPFDMKQVDVEGWTPGPQD
jgi:2-amino-4-hydroxy-6-hydroxymethyldihydropteridine diphosphokinase